MPSCADRLDDIFGALPDCQYFGCKQSSTFCALPPKLAKLKNMRITQLGDAL
jgi:hypothetical protein